MASDGLLAEPPAAFDEAYYLSTYPDVGAAVAAGHFQSGLQHYQQWGRAEGRLSHAAAEPVLTEQERRDRVGAVWSVNPEAAAGWYWMAHPMVRDRVNALASGGDPRMDSYGRLKLLLQQRGVPLPLGRAVSLGCGFGGLERGLAAEGIIDEIDAYDLAPGAIAEARRLAAEAGLHSLRYHVADLETIAFPPGEIDVVFAHSSVHHVERLEELFETVAAMLKPGGIFHLNEFVGPTRFQWTDAQMAGVNRFLESLPPRLRRLPSGQPRPLQARPTVAAMIEADPSEAIRSSDIRPLIGRTFDILEVRELGGALLHLGLAGIAQNFDPDDADDRSILEDFFAEEDRAMRDGEVGSDFATITAVVRPRTKIVTEPSSSMPKPSLATSLSLLFPPARRLHEAVRTLNAAVGRIAAENAALHAEQAVLQAEQLRLRSQTMASPPVPPAATSQAPLLAALDQSTGRELQAAALRHMPFLPGAIAMTPEGLYVQGHAGAPEGLTDSMAFFVNGRRFDQVEYPVLDSELASRFTEVHGMGFVTRMTMTQHLDELRAAVFWRFDASPTGHYVPAHWRQAIHFKNPAFERFPLPPVPNIKRVIGDTDATRFAMGGAMIFKNIESLLSEMELGWQDFPRVLDWGCGAGRVTRYMLGETSCNVTGADIDPDNIAWCRASYPGARFETVPLRPPTMFDDGEFDLVTGLSVMTHLQEDDQWRWLAELRRITRPGALLFLSVQGPTQYAYNRFPAALYRQVQEQGYLDLSRDGALDDVIADKEYYRVAMHSRPYIVQRWGEYFEALAIVDAVAGLQDFVVLRRR